MAADEQDSRTAAALSSGSQIRSVQQVSDEFLNTMIKSEPEPEDDEDILLPEEAVLPRPVPSDVTIQRVRIPAQPSSYNQRQPTTNGVSSFTVVYPTTTNQSVNNDRQFITVKGPSQLMPSSQLNSCNCCIEDITKETDDPINRDFKLTMKYLEMGKPEVNFKVWHESLARNYANCVIDWLTACNHTRKLYCWPCLLFGRVRDSWNAGGFSQYRSIQKVHKPHENSVLHVVSTVRYQMVVGKPEKPIDMMEWLNLKKIVEINKRDVEKTFETVCLLLQGHEVYDNSSLLRLAHTRNNDRLMSIPNLHSHMLTAVASVLNEMIRSEINAAPFYSITLDTISEKTMFATVHYITDSGEPVERFVNVYNNDDPNKIIKTIKLSLEEGPFHLLSINVGNVSRLDEIPRMPNTKTLVIQSPTHRMNHVLPTSLMKIRECCAFFLTIQGLATWVAESEQELAAEFPNISYLRWKEKLIETTRENKNQLRELILSSMEKSTNYSGEKYTLVLGLINAFKELEFTFLLSVFGDLFPIADSLQDIFFKTSHDIQLCTKTLKEYIQVINWAKEKFDDLWEAANQDNFQDEMAPPAAKRPRNIKSSKLANYYRKIYNEIIDTIAHQLELRFIDFAFMEVIGLLESSRAGKTTHEKYLFQLQRFCEDNDFEHTRLKIELQALVEHIEMKGVGLTLRDKLRELEATKNSKVLSEALKLGRFIMTMPYMNKVNQESSAKLYAKIRECVTKKSQVPLILQIHADLIHKLSDDTEFTAKLLDIFGQNNPNIKLTCSPK